MTKKTSCRRRFLWVRVLFVRNNIKYQSIAKAVATFSASVCCYTPHTTPLAACQPAPKLKLLSPGNFDGQTSFFPARSLSLAFMFGDTFRIKWLNLCAPLHPWGAARHHHYDNHKICSAGESQKKSLCAAPGEEGKGFAAVTTSYIFSTMSCLSAWHKNRRAEAMRSNRLCCGNLNFAQS